jgi:glyoxylase-like metal-dependent hydrolase (beta-lactamase superfamily II)
MREIAPGIVHWTARHPGIGEEVSSYLLPAAGVALNPMVPAEGLEELRSYGEPSDVVLTNRHHYRDSDRFVEAFGATVHCHQAGMHEFGLGQRVVPFSFGDELPGGLRALEVGAISPEETAIHAPAQRALAVADGVINESTLTFVPDGLMGDDPEGVKRGLLAAFARLLEEDWAHLLCAHGDPVADTGHEALAAFVAAH